MQAVTPWKRVAAGLQQLQGAATPEAEPLLRAVQELLDQQQAFTRSSTQEVGDALSFLSQQLLTLDGAPGDDDVLGQARAGLCRLAAGALSEGQHASLSSRAAQIVGCALRSWADYPPYDGQGASASNGRASLRSQPCSPPQGSMRRAAASKAGPHRLQCQALAALAAFIPGNISKLPAPEVAALLAVITSAAHPSPAVVDIGCGGMAAGALPATHGSDAAVERAQQALAALATCFPRSQSSLIAPEHTGNTTAALCSALHSWCNGRGRPAASPAQARLLATLLKLINTVVTEGKAAWVPLAGPLVGDLRKLLTYGASGPSPGLSPAGSPGLPQPSSGSAGGAQDSGGSGGRPARSSSSSSYVPPHARGKPQSSQAPRASERGWSDSDVSDAEGGATGSDRSSGATRVRLGVQVCLQSMARSDSRALHSHWTALLPVHGPALAPRPLLPHLITVLLHDPVPKVRAMAAATVAGLLEGPAAKGYLMVADARGASTPGKGGTGPSSSLSFTSLSASLGQMVACTHAGLLAAVQSEPTPLVLLSVLRAVAVLITATPPDRASPHMLPDTLRAVRARHAALVAAPAQASLSAAEQAALLTARLCCVAETLATKKAAPAMAAELSTPAAAATPGGIRQAQGEQQQQQQPCQTVGGALAVDLLSHAGHPQPTVRIEALAALRGLVEHYLETVGDATKRAGLWAGLLDVTQNHLTIPLPSGPSDASRPLSRSSSAKGMQDAASSTLAQQGSWRQGGSQDAGPQTVQPPAQPPHIGGAADIKACQQAVKALGAFLASAAGLSGAGGPPGTGAMEHTTDASSTISLPPFLLLSGRPPSPEAQPPQPGSPQGGDRVGGLLQECSALWADALALLVPVATGHPSPMVQAAALGVLSELPWTVFASQAAAMQRAVAHAGPTACGLDQPTAAAPPAAVCAAACKLIGAVLSFPGALDDVALCGPGLEALPGLVRHEAQSVRAAASWALAAACETAAAAVATVANASTDGRRLPQAFEAHVAAVGDAAVAAAQGDNERVHANALRAVGALLYCLPWGTDTQKWLDCALRAVQSALTAGSPKAQCGACAATHALLVSPTALRSGAVQPAACAPLLLLLVMLVRDAGSWKVRSQAAAALGALPDRALAGSVLPDALLVTAAALDTLEPGGSGVGDVAATGLASGKPGSKGGNQNGGSSASTSGTTAAGGEVGFPNYKHLPALLAQLRATLARLAGLLADEDVQRHREGLIKRLPAVLRALDDLAQAAMQGHSPGRRSTGDSLAAALPDQLTVEPEQPGQGQPTLGAHASASWSPGPDWVLELLQAPADDATAGTRSGVALQVCTALLALRPLRRLAPPTLPVMEKLGVWLAAAEAASTLCALPVGIPHG